MKKKSKKQYAKNLITTFVKRAINNSWKGQKKAKIKNIGQALKYRLKAEKVKPQDYEVPDVDDKWGDFGDTDRQFYGYEKGLRIAIRKAYGYNLEDENTMLELILGVEGISPENLSYILEKRSKELHIDIFYSKLMRKKKQKGKVVELDTNRFKLQLEKEMRYIRSHRQELIDRYISSQLPADVPLD